LLKIMVRITYTVTGNIELGKKLTKLYKRIETEPNRTIQRMADEIQLEAMMLAPKRTGSLAANIRRSGGRNWANVGLGLVSGSANNGNPSYPMLIDTGHVKDEWGLMRRPGMIDTRSREEKLYFFVGNEANEGKTLSYAKKNFPRHVGELVEKIKIR